MLVLSRKQAESICISDNIVISEEREEGDEGNRTEVPATIRGQKRKGPGRIQLEFATGGTPGEERRVPEYGRERSCSGHVQVCHGVRESRGASAMAAGGR